MKTKEELEALKKEVQELNSKLQELTDDEVKAVAGGSGGEETRDIHGYVFTGHVPADEVRKGHTYYFTKDGKENWYRGTVIEIKDYWWFGTRYKFVLRLTDKDGYGASGTWEVDSWDWTAYTTMTRHW